MAACGGGAAGGPASLPDGDTSITYKSVDDETKAAYTLTVNKASGRAAYTPGAGDTYILIIIGANGSEIGRSAGAVTSVEEGRLRLTTRANPIIVRTSGAGIGSIDASANNGGIPLEGDRIQPAPETLIPDGASTAAPILTDFITLPYVFSYDVHFWGPKTVWKTGGTGDMEIQKLNVAIRGTIPDNADVKSYAFTLVGTNISRTGDFSKPSGNPKAFTWFMGSYDLTGLTAGQYTAEVYITDTLGRQSNKLRTTFEVRDNVETTPGSAPVLNDFITLTYTDGINKVWNAKTEWKAGGTGDAGIQKLNVAVKVTDTDRDLLGYMLTFESTPPLVVKRVYPETVYSNQNFTWYMGSWDLTKLTAGTYTAKIHLVDKQGNRSVEKTATFTVVN
jgi:hypothetical protein